MTDIATLGVAVDSRPVENFTKAMSSATAEAARMEAAVRRATDTDGSVAARVFRVNKEIENMVASQAKVAATVQVQKQATDSAAASLGKYAMSANDASLNILVLQAAQEEFNKGTEEAISKLKEMGGTVNNGGVSLKELGLNTRLAKHELIQLGKEAVSGDFAQMPKTFASLVAHSKLLHLAMSPIGAVIAAVAVAVGVLGFAAVKGAQEVAEMNKAIQLTSNYAGMTRGTMRELAKEMTTVSSITIGTSKEIVTSLVNSGQIGSAAIAAVAKLSADYAAATGKDVEKVAPELVKLFADPAKGAEELNRQMHFLAPAEVDHIEHLIRIGELGRAQLELAEKLASHIKKDISELGLFEAAWDSVRKTASVAWDAMLGIGRKKTLEDQLADAKRSLDLFSGPGNELAGADAPRRGTLAPGLRTLITADPSGRAAAEKAVQNIEDQIYLKRVDATREADKTERSAAANKVRGLIEQNSLLSQEAKLKANIADIEKNGGGTPQAQQAILAIKKQIADLGRKSGGGADDSKRLAEEKLNSELKLFEIENRANNERLKTAVTLGELTSTQGDQRKLQLDLELITARIYREEQAVGINKLKGSEKLRHEDNIKALKAEAALRQLTFNDALKVKAAEAVAEQAKVDAEVKRDIAVAQLKEIENLDKEIAKLKERNDHIGKTKEQIDLLRAAEIDLLIVEKERDKSTSEAAENDPYILRINAQIERLQLKKQLELRGAVLEAEAERVKKETQEMKQLGHELGGVFNNAFESMQQGGKGVRDVLKGIEQDIVRIINRKLITEPLAKWFENQLSPSSGAGGLGGILGMFGIGGQASSSGTINSFGTGGGFINNLFSGGGADLGVNFASGGDFKVGGSGGVDKTPVRFNATRGEIVSVRTPAQMASSDSNKNIQVVNNFHITGSPTRQSQSQLSVAAGQGVNRALARDT